MYEKILQEDIHEDHRPLAIKVLQWLAVSYRPLSIIEISEVCTIPSGRELRGATTLIQDYRLTQEQLLNLLPDLVVSIQVDSASGSGPRYSSLAFAHFSVQEYLMGSSSTNSRVQARDSHALVAEESLAYLFMLREMGPKGPLARYATEHWQLHAVATGKLDEETRMNAFLLAASILSVAPSTDKKELPRDFIRVTQWLKDSESTDKLISYLRAWSQPAQGDTMRLAILYPQCEGEDVISCRVHTVSHMYAPSYEAIYSNRDQSAMRAEILLNDRRFSVTGDTFQSLQGLRQASTIIRLIWMDSVCSDGSFTPMKDRIASTDTMMHRRVMYRRVMYRRAVRVMVHLDGRLERKQWNFGILGGPNAKIPELRLTALEKLLSTQHSNVLWGVFAWELEFARDVVFLHDGDELSLDDIRESLDHCQAATPPTAGFVNELIIYGLLVLVPAFPKALEWAVCRYRKDFPHTETILDHLQSKEAKAAKQGFDNMYCEH